MVKSAHSSSKDQYIALAHRLPVFMQAWWLDATCSADWDVALVKKDGNIIAVWPFQKERKWIFSIVRNPLLTPYLGPFFLQEFSSSADRNDCLKQLRQQLPKVDFLQWTSFPHVPTGDFFTQPNLKQVSRRTFVIDLSLSEDALWEALHVKRKNAIRKAHKDLSVRMAPIDWSLFIQHHRKAFEEKHTHYPYLLHHFTQLNEVLERHKSVLTLQAINEQGCIEAQALFVVDHNNMYYLLSATKDQPHRGAVAAVIWEAMLEAKKQGLKCFDFEGSMDEGIAHFYKRFGAKETQYMYYEQCNSILWTLKRRYWS